MAGIAIACVLALVVVLIGVIALAGSGSGTGTLTFSPSTLHCGQHFTITTRLPASVNAADYITIEVDGARGTTTRVGSLYAKQSDGSWLHRETSPSSWTCQSTGGLSIGDHVMRILDSKSRVLATGRYTVAA